MSIPTTTDNSPSTAPNPASGPSQGGIARRLVLGSLGSIQSGLLHLREGSETTTLGKPAEDGLEATIDVLDGRFYRSTLLRG